MSGQYGFHINRFGEVFEDLGSRGSDLTTRNIGDLKFELSDDLKRAIEIMNDKINLELNKQTTSLGGRLDKLEEQFLFTKSYVSVKSRRVVSADKAINDTDLVTKEQLDDVFSQLKDLLAVFDLTTQPDSILVKNHRRIGTVSKSKYPFDVVVRKEFVEFQTAVNERMESFTQHLNPIIKVVNTIKPECLDNTKKG